MLFSEFHNFGLYCNPKGKLVMIPWDYDLSFGTFFPGTAESTANYDIDIMYCMNESWQDYENHEYSAEVYSKFPLFNVIFNNSSLMLVFPDQLGDEVKETITFSKPIVSNDVRLYQRIGAWIYKWLKKQ